MSADHWRIGIEAGGKYLHLDFTVHEDKLFVNLTDQGEEYADCQGDNRPHKPAES